MNVAYLTVVLVAAAACSAGRHLERAPLVPPLLLATTEGSVVLLRDVGQRTDADRSAPAVLPIESAREVATTGPAYRIVTHFVETPVVERPAEDRAAADFDDDSGVAYEPRDGGYYDGYYGPGYYHDGRWRRRWFPANTFVGAGVGAILGHQHGHRHRGALIGAGAGLLLDLPRLWLPRLWR